MLGQYAKSLPMECLAQSLGIADNLSCIWFAKFERLGARDGFASHVM
jgi:hypothetical protein